MSHTSIPAVFREQVAKLQSRPMVYGKRAGHWRPLTWGQMGARVRAAAGGLVSLGLGPGDVVGLLAESGPEWVLADLAALSAGCADAPVYDEAPRNQVGYMLNDAGCRLVFVGDDESLATILAVREEAPALRWIVSLDETVPPPPPVDGLEYLTLLELEERGADLELAIEVDRRVAAIDGDQLLTLIYTSGTTGEPKGVRITHRNMVANCDATSRAIPLRSDDVVLSFLPLSHAFERMAGYYSAALWGGATVFYAEGAGRLFHNMREVRPTLMTGVPRVFEKVYAQFHSNTERGDPVRRRLVDWALSVGRKASRLRQAGKEPGALLSMQLSLAHDQVFARLYDRLGGRVRFFICGGAHLSPEIAEFFHASGLLILEGYGLSEASPVVAVNRPEAFRFGSVGRPLDNVRVRVAHEDGEILVRGESVMQGYHNLPDETAEVLRDGWLHTGDIGRLDADGFLYITDRKKDLFKTSTGKYVAPQRLERMLRTDGPVEQACIVGDGRPYCVALLVPDFAELEGWAAERGVSGLDRRALVEHPMVVRRFQKAVDRVNAQLERHEAIRAFRVLTDPFTEANGLLTPSKKVRRREVALQLAGIIEGLYSEGTGRLGQRRALRSVGG